MQRWIVWGLVGLVAMMLMIGGGGYAYRNYKMNRPHPVWVPLPINPSLPLEKRNEIAKDLKEKLSKFEILLQVSHELGLAKKWNLASDEEAAMEMGTRLFVKVGEADGPMGKVPSINIGLTGKSKDREITEKVTLRLMEDVMKIAGIKSPTPQNTPPF
jgi:hypothetical protein